MSVYSNYGPCIDTEAFSLDWAVMEHLTTTTPIPLSFIYAHTIGLFDWGSSGYYLKYKKADNANHL